MRWDKKWDSPSPLELALFLFLTIDKMTHLNEGITTRGIGMKPYYTLLLIALAGCATSAENIQPIYVSPLQYQNLTCAQIGAEASRVSQRAAQVAGVQDKNATNDAVATGVGIILFWPVLFFMEGDGQNAAELGRLRGEFETLEKVAIQKECGLEFRRPAPEPKHEAARNDEYVPPKPY